jgi:hypothetical protein
MKYFFTILITLCVIFLFSFFFKVTKWYGNNKFVPKYPNNNHPQNQMIVNQCKIAHNPFFYNQNFHT